MALPSFLLHLESRLDLRPHEGHRMCSRVQSAGLVVMQGHIAALDCLACVARVWTRPCSAQTQVAKSAAPARALRAALCTASHTQCRMYCIRP